MVTASILEKLFTEYPDDLVFPLIVESDDWDNKIQLALEEIVNWHNKDIIDDITLFQFLRGVLQICYVMGYFRGKKE
jgi:hypothetical protein